MRAQNIAPASVGGINISTEYLHWFIVPYRLENAWMMPPRSMVASSTVWRHAVLWEKEGGLILLGGVAGEAYAELFEDFAVDFAEHHGGMYLTACEFG